MNFTKHFLLDPVSVIEYVKVKTKIFSPAANLSATEIGDGNINYIFRITDEDTKQSIIIKQADKLLRQSGRPLDVDRNRIEAEVLIMEGKFAEGLVPEVYFYDPVMCVIGMEDISSYQNLRKALMERKTFLHFSDHITTFIVNTLLPTTDLVMDAGAKKVAVKKYVNPDLCKITEDLVLTEPYINYKQRNIIIEENQNFVQKELYQDEALILEVGKLKQNFMNNAQCLLHGDLHTGSIFVSADSIKVIDPEFAFYGPLGYDLGNVIGNLFFALGNVYVTESILPEAYIAWLRETIEKLISLFISKFNKKYKEIVTDVMFKKPFFMKYYLDTILTDAIGFAGCEIIRRVVGDAKVDEVTLVKDKNKRITLERILILSGKEFIMKQKQIKTGIDYLNIFDNIMLNIL